MLQSIGSLRVGHGSVTEQQRKYILSSQIYVFWPNFFKISKLKFYPLAWTYIWMFNKYLTIKLSKAEYIFPAFSDHESSFHPVLSNFSTYYHKLSNFLSLDFRNHCWFLFFSLMLTFNPLVRFIDFKTYPNPALLSLFPQIPQPLVPPLFSRFISAFSIGFPASISSSIHSIFPTTSGVKILRM